MDSSNNLLDRIRGMFAAHHLGDALGAPHEFYKWNRNTVYTGKLEIEPFRRGGSRYKQEDIRHPVGSVTDDTHMTIALLRSILDKGEYDFENTVVEYTNWVHSGTKEIGVNTGYIFKNETLKGYYLRVARRDREIEAGTMRVSLSNGPLMRCTPLALLDNWSDAAIEDVKMTNPYIESICINLIYLFILREALSGASADKLVSIAYSAVRVLTDHPELHELYNVCMLALNNEQDVDISGKDKGLGRYALYCALRGLVLLATGQSYAAIIRWIITQGTDTGKGDTDTNAAIAGGLLGAILGYDKLMQSERTRQNWTVLIEAARDVTGKLSDYVPYDYDELCEEYYELVKKQ
ncbi:ADP-ribosylglycohydrolase [uncultured virus]|nr:ADP-ribosylglycohydrolase [uncultured virus]